MAYDPREKFVEDGTWAVFLGTLTDAELREGDERIKAGEDWVAVWRDISRRDPDRWERERSRVGRTFAEIARDERQR